jgi:hypothetical protein
VSRYLADALFVEEFATARALGCGGCGDWDFEPANFAERVEEWAVNTEIAGEHHPKVVKALEVFRAAAADALAGRLAVARRKLHRSQRLLRDTGLFW